MCPGGQAGHRHPGSDQEWGGRREQGGDRAPGLGTGVGGVSPWPRVLREGADTPSLEAFQARLDGALSTRIPLKMSLLTAGGWA